LEWLLTAGSSLGERDLHDSGVLGDVLTDTVDGLPADGRPIYVRLWYRLGDTWYSTDSQYTAPILP
jgi:hypothetical protein